MQATLDRSRRQKVNRLIWPAHPSRSRHKILGPRNTWTSSCNRFRIIQFPKATAKFMAVDDTSDHLGCFSSLGGAKLACERQHRGLNGKVASRGADR